MSTRSSINDQAIKSAEENFLETEKYIEALSSFIKISATPLTIGIQGEWGSGKTSMMNLICSNMEEANIATAWVNTWEYSIFREPGEIAPAVMIGLIESLKNTVGNKWPKDLSKRVEKVKGLLKGVAKVAFEAGVKTATGMSGASEALDKTIVHDKSELATIREDLSTIVKSLTQKNNLYESVVFFIDDLDRIDPVVAVNILEVLKNIFEIDGCVFVLAIDYDVVVKGLESKFGKKTVDNEREFRSFFDKLIQVPFSIPVSNYNIDKLLENRFEAIGYILPKKYEEEFRNTISYTVGVNPRSIKRYINTFSLLKMISNLSEDNDETDENIDELSEFLLLSFVGIQIAYPSVYQLLIINPDYISWEEVFAESLNITVNIPDKLKSHELYNELWEQILWSYLQKDPYLKTSANSVLSVLNLIRKAICKDNSQSSLGYFVEKTLQMTNITSVEDDNITNPKKNERIVFDTFKDFREFQESQRNRHKENMDFIEKIKNLVLNRCDELGVSIKMRYAKTEFGFLLDDENLRRSNKILAIIPQRGKGFKYWGPSLKATGFVVSGDESNDMLWQTLDDSIDFIKERAKEKEISLADNPSNRTED